MYLVQQLSPFHCFPACLVSFFTDLNLPLTQEEVVNRCPNAFYKGQNIEGAITLDDNSLKTVANEFNIKITTPTTNQIKLDKFSSVFVFVYWQNDPTQNFCLSWLLNKESAIRDEREASTLNIANAANLLASKAVLINSRQLRYAIHATIIALIPVIIAIKKDIFEIISSFIK